MSCAQCCQGMIATRYTVSACSQGTGPACSQGPAQKESQSLQPSCPVRGLQRQMALSSWCSWCSRDRCCVSKHLTAAGSLWCPGAAGSVPAGGSTSFTLSYDISQNQFQTTLTAQVLITTSGRPSAKVRRHSTIFVPSQEPSRDRSKNPPGQAQQPQLPLACCFQAP